MLGGAQKSKSPFNPRRLLRMSLAAPFVAFVLLGPSRLVMNTMGLTESASVALLLVTLAAGLWVTEAIPLYVTSLLLLFLEIAWLLPVMEAEAFGDARYVLGAFLLERHPAFSRRLSLSTAFRRYFLDRMIAKLVLARGGDSRAVVAAVMFVSAFLSM